MTGHPPSASLALPARPGPLPRIDLSGVHPAGLHPGGPKHPGSDPAPTGIDIDIDRTLLDHYGGGQPPVDMAAMQGAQAAPTGNSTAAAHPRIDPAMLPGPRAVPAWKPKS